MLSYLVHIKVAVLRSRLQTNIDFLPWVAVSRDGGGTVQQCDPRLIFCNSVADTKLQLSELCRGERRCSSASINALIHVTPLGLRMVHHHVQTDAEHTEV